MSETTIEVGQWVRIKQSTKIVERDTDLKEIQRIGALGKVVVKPGHDSTNRLKVDFGGLWAYFDQGELEQEDTSAIDSDMNASRIAELERALAAKDAEIAALREALTPFANAAEDEDVMGEFPDVNLLTEERMLCIYIERGEFAANDESQFLKVKHLRAAADALKADTK